MNTTLKSFWAYGAVGHVNSEGIDVGQEFLRNTFKDISSISFTDCVIYSHFESINAASRILEQIEYLTNKRSRSELEKRTRLHGHFKKKNKLEKSIFNVWSTSENIRPPLDEEFNIFLSHDLDTYDGRNIYLPIWATRLGVTIAEAKEAQKKLLVRRNGDVGLRSGICAIVSNPEPIRMAFLRELQRVFPVDIYGALGSPVDDKFQILSKYKFNVCFENVESPGYITEKPIESWIGGCIPIWKGIDPIQSLNQNSIINVTRDGFAKTIETIETLMNDEDQFNSKWRQPILLNPYNFDEFQQNLLKLSNYKK